MYTGCSPYIPECGVGEGVVVRGGGDLGIGFKYCLSKIERAWGHLNLIY